MKQPARQIRNASGRRFVRILCAPLACALLCTLTSAAAAQPVVRATQVANEAEDTRPLFARIDVVDASRMLVPIDTSVFLDAAGKPLTDFAVLLEDGTRLMHSLHALRVQFAVPSYAEPATQATRLAQWLGPRTTTSAREVTQLEALSLADDETLFIAIDPPARPTGATIWIGGQRVPVQWLAPLAAQLETDERLNPAAGSRAWLPTRGPMNTVAIADLLATEAVQPETRWRARLVEDGLSPINDTRFPRAQDPFVAALADQLVRRWQIALAQLHTHDAELALQVRSALGLLAEVEPRVSVPAWNPLPASTQRLLTDLLDMRLSPQRRADLATQWLREQPTFTAWVRDDGGVLVEKHAEESSEPRSPLATIALTNLSAREELAWIAPRDSAAAPDPRPLEPRRTLAVATPVLPLDVAGQQLAQRGVAAMLAPDARRDIVATLGDDAIRLSVVDGPIAVTPPGLATGVFARDMQLAEWLSAATPTDDPAWATAAMIYREAPSPSDPGTTNPRRLWRVLVECALPDTADRSRESLWLFTGTPNAAIHIWRISFDGTITGMREQDRELATLGDAPRRATVATVPGGVALHIPMPPGAIESDGLLRLGIIRMDARGVRTAWPRALTPWQEEPSRAVLDTTTWDARIDRP